MTNEELAAQAQQGDKLALEKLWLQVYKLLYLMCGRAYVIAMVVLSVHAQRCNA
ncbi:MAG: hypothetical protein ACLTE2_12490 [Eubacteriales bacterium]